MCVSADPKAVRNGCLVCLCAFRYQDSPEGAHSQHTALSGSAGSYLTDQFRNLEGQSYRPPLEGIVLDRTWWSGCV